MTWPPQIHVHHHKKGIRIIIFQTKNSFSSGIHSPLYSGLSTNLVFLSQGRFSALAISISPSPEHTGASVGCPNCRRYSSVPYRQYKSITCVSSFLISRIRSCCNKIHEKQSRVIGSKLPQCLPFWQRPVASHGLLHETTPPPSWYCSSACCFTVTIIQPHETL